MKELKNILHEGNHSLIVYNGVLYTFDGKGISDLYRLLKKKPMILSGASVADKIIGKAAAALMVLGGVKEVFTDIISVQAIDLLNDSGITIHYEQVVNHIKNQTNTGWCPMEICCKPCTSASECLDEIEKLITNTQNHE